ncbi:hypothetical protein DH2020_002469 [Rehmannia glutinosa]|uniref:Uncharacterized protein n=1 Tax=Rehmannia glutinosa TaxID=99300 RepID=A0ABR0XU78_REHGL
MKNVISGEGKFAKKQEIEKPKEDEKAKTQVEGDLLNLGADAPTTQEHDDKLALTLFNGGPATSTTSDTKTPWEAFKESPRDWEMALVQSASHLSNQKANLPGGFDMLILYGMYQQGVTAQAVASSGLVATGSASSVTLGRSNLRFFCLLVIEKGCLFFHISESSPYSRVMPFRSQKCLLESEWHFMHFQLVPLSLHRPSGFPSIKASLSCKENGVEKSPCGDISSVLQYREEIKKKISSSTSTVPKLSSILPRDSIFGNFLDFAYNGFSCNVALHTLVAMEIRMSDALESECWFHIGEQSIRFAQREFAMVSGMRFVRSVFDPTRVYEPPETEDTEQWETFPWGKYSFQILILSLESE